MHLYKTAFAILLLILTHFTPINVIAAGLVVFQSDFGMKDAAVSEVKGVMYSVDESLLITDLTHEIPSFNIWDAAYRLYQTAPYWPAGTVFVSVVDPGVGTRRRSVVAETNNGLYFVTPDNGSLTLINDLLGIKSVRIIDETTNRLNNSTASHTFHGRDVYGYTAARLAAGKISYEQVGPLMKQSIIKLPYQKQSLADNKLKGTIVVLDPQFGNVWTNISKTWMDKFNLKPGENYRVKIYQNNQLKFNHILPYQNTFGNVEKGKSLIYVNSLLNLAIASNQGNFAKTHHIESGPRWNIVIEKLG